MLPLSVNFRAVLQYVGISVLHNNCAALKYTEKYGLWKVFTLANEDDGYYLHCIGNLSTPFL